VGLVATKVSQLTGKAAFIVALSEDQGIGSARGKEEDNLPQALASAASHLERFGGHAQAAGFSLRAESFDAFKLAISDHYKENYFQQEAFEKVYDTEAKLTEFSEAFMSWLKSAGPFGTENPNPLFRITN